MQVGEEAPATYIDLGCVDPGFRDAFGALAADLVLRLAGGTGASREIVAETLRRWRRFWAVPQAGLSEEEALGLFGELWFLERWIGVPLGVARWTGPSGSRHDFQWPEASVEVKASRVGIDGAAVHRISNLDQLADPESGRLYLYSLHVNRDALASNTLPGIVARLDAALEHRGEAQLAFRERLAAIGYSPAHASRYDQRWRVTAEELYRVETGFPRLTRCSFGAGLPAGVQEVSYCLDLAACGPWRTATRPTDPGLDFLRT
jgi:hypothetical protein